MSLCCLGWRLWIEALFSLRISFSLTLSFGRVLTIVKRIHGRKSHQRDDRYKWKFCQGENSSIVLDFSREFTASSPRDCLITQVMIHDGKKVEKPRLFSVKIADKMFKAHVLLGFFNNCSWNWSCVNDVLLLGLIHVTIPNFGLPL